MITGRTYNQFHLPRAYERGKRRLSVYWAWSYPWEANRDLTHLDNRFSTMTEVRRVGWPNYETEQFSHEMFQQGIAGTLELFHLGLVPFQDLAGEASGTPVASYQRVDQAGVRLPIDERILADTDTLLIFGLDHIATNQDAAPEEVAALREFLKREGTVLLIGPHHDVGATNDFKQRDMEYRHHGDRLVPSQQRFSTYTRGLLKGLGIPVENQWGLRPATVEGTRTPVPLLKATDLDTRGWLDGVTNFVFHQHLPHYAVTGGDNKSIHVLARQPVNLDRPHPFTAAGNTEFNMFLWMPPSGERAGDIIMADSTLFVNLFGGDESLRNFWRNIATK